MSDTVNKFTKKLILTNYGRTRVLERIAKGTDFIPFNFTGIAIGDKMQSFYGPNITVMGNEIACFDISDENVTIQDNVATIETNLELPDDTLMQEVGLYEVIDGKKSLFAYASGFSMIKNSTLSFSLIIDLSLSLTFENEHYSKYPVSLRNSPYALMPKINGLFRALTLSQMDLERCIESNTIEIGYNKAQPFIEQHRKNIEVLKNILTVGRLNRVLRRFNSNEITDCFFFPSEIYNKSLKNKYTDDIGRVYTLVSPIYSEPYFLSEYGVQYPAILKNDESGFNRDGKFVKLTKIHTVHKPHNYIVKNIKDDVSNEYTDAKGTLYKLVTPFDGPRYFVDTQNHQYSYALDNENHEGYYKTNGNFVVLNKIPESVISITGELQLSTRENIDLRGPVSIIHHAKLGTFSKENFILGKINPNEDEYYFDLRMVKGPVTRTVIKDGEETLETNNEYGLQFTIYSYDKEKEPLTEFAKFDAETKVSTVDEPKLVGHYRITYFPTDGERALMTNKEAMFTYIYNGNIENPEVKLYIGNELMNNKSEGFIVDNFNYMGPCEYFRTKCTLRNYTQTVTTVNFKKPDYYLIPEVETSSIIVFNRELSEEEIVYLSLISKS